MDWDNATILPDMRFDYPEPRFWTFGLLGGRLHLAAYCERGGAIRVISFHKANAREGRRYGKKT